jgi:hypothetical protein
METVHSEEVGMEFPVVVGTASIQRCLLISNLFAN